MARKIEVQIVGDADSLHRALGKAQGASSKFGSVLGGAFKVAAVGAGAAVLGLGYALKRGIDDFNEGQKASAQTAAVLKSTGHAAQVTAKHVTDLAQAVSDYSGIDDEVVQGGENMLLTFKNIRNEVGKGNDIFDQSTKILADMSTAMGSDMKSSAIQLGKALNDPVKGITALTRVGVTFSDKQKQLIQHLVDTGHAADAQKVILKELRSEFGGSAKAAGDTMAGAMNKLKNAFDNAASSVIQQLLPYVVRLAQFAFPLVVGAIRHVAGAIKGAIKWVAQMASHFAILGGKSSSAGSRIRNAWGQVVSFFRGSVMPVIQRLRGIFTDAMANIAKVVQKNGPAITRIFDRISSAIKAIAKVAVPLLRYALTKVLPRAIDGVIKFLDNLSFAIAKVVGWLDDAVNSANNLKHSLDFLGSLNTGLLSHLGVSIDPTKGLLNQLSGNVAGVPSAARPANGNITFVAQLDGRTLFSHTVSQDKMYKRQNGRSAFA